MAQKVFVCPREPQYWSWSEMATRVVLERDWGTPVARVEHMAEERPWTMRNWGSQQRTLGMRAQQGGWHRCRVNWALIQGLDPLWALPLL